MILACVTFVWSGGWLQVTEIEQVILELGAIAPGWVYLVVALGVAVENVFPPIPADTFVVLGAFLSAQGRVTGSGVFLATWSMNTGTAMLTYGLARRWGRAVLDTRPGRWFLRPRQLERLAALYNAHGSKIIFFCRFLPAFRALVPVFAGISHLAFWRTALPIAFASAIWYGVLIYAGSELGKNWRVILEMLNEVNLLLLVITMFVGGGLVVVWWKTRHGPREASGEGTGP
jgi:membrane protein DedA with SNARE-associated domain